MGLYRNCDTLERRRIASAIICFQSLYYIANCTVTKTFSISFGCAVSKNTRIKRKKKPPLPSSSTFISSPSHKIAASTTFLLFYYGGRSALRISQACVFVLFSLHFDSFGHIFIYSHFSHLLDKVVDNDRIRNGTKPKRNR